MEEHDCPNDRNGCTGKMTFDEDRDCWVCPECGCLATFTILSERPEDSFVNNE